MGRDDNPPSFQSFAEGYGEDAPAAILTTAQREYFFGDKEFSGGSERAVKRRIRQRIVAGLWDLTLLSQAYPDDELEKVRPDSGDRTHPTDALASFLYRLQSENAVIGEDLLKGGDPTGRDRRAARVEGDVSRGIEKVIKQHEGVDAEVDTTITVDRGDELESLAQGDLSQLSREQLDTLLYTGEISREEYAEANEQRLKRNFGEESE